MSSKYRLLFAHGWGFSKEFWKPVANLFQGFTIDYIDLGYLDNQVTSDKALQIIQKNQDNIIAIGHSLGFIYLLKQFPLKFYHYVAINGFLRFSKADDFASGVPLRILQRMSKNIEKDSSAVLSQFYEQCQYHQTPSLILNIEQLKIGLEWLEKNDFRSCLSTIQNRLTVIASDHDPVVSKEMTSHSFKNQPIQWVEDKTHILPIKKPELCASIIRNTLISNEL